MKNKETNKNGDDWIQKKWRPMMAVMYMAVCTFDFILFPIMFTIVQFWETQAVNDAFRQWQPITLLGGGLFHVAMGAVLGVTAWSRGQEKIAGVSINQGNVQNGYNIPQGMPTTFGSYSSGGINSPSNNSFSTTPYQSGQNYTTVEQSRETFTATPVIASYKGKKAPIQPEDPVI